MARSDPSDRSWLERVIIRKVPLAKFEQAYEHPKGDVKTVLLFED